MYQHLNSTVVGNSELLDTSTNVTTFYFLSKLQTLKFHHISNLYWYGAFLPSVCWKDNKLVNIDGSFLTALYIKDTIFCLDHLKYLNLRGIKRLILGAKSFYALPNLEVLMLGSSNINSST